MEKRNIGIPFRNGCSRNLFRGAIVDAGQKCNLKGEPLPAEWIYGSMCMKGDGDFAIIYDYKDRKMEKTPVYTDTCCQYIGIKDKNGAAIFENDILSNKDGDLVLVKESLLGYGYDFVSLENKLTIHPDIESRTGGDNYCLDLYVAGNAYDYECNIPLHPDQSPVSEKECSDEENVDHDL